MEKPPDLAKAGKNEIHSDQLIVAAAITQLTCLEAIMHSSAALCALSAEYKLTLTMSLLQLHRPLCHASHQPSQACCVVQ